MNWRNLPYWLKGGIIAIPLSFIVTPLSFFVTQAMGNGDDPLWYLAPEFFGAGLALGMRGTPAGTVEVVTTLLIALAMFVARFFVIGAILGKVYEWFSRRGYKIIFLFLLIIVYASFLFYISYTTQSVHRAYQLSNSVAECTSDVNKWIDNFDVNSCIRQVAIKNGDTSLCDQIMNVSVGVSIEDERGYCYEEVAHAGGGSSICPTIPTQGRRDSCYLQFFMCEDIIDMGWRDNCWQTKGMRENDLSYCEKVSSRERSQCIEHVHWANK